MYPDQGIDPGFGDNLIKCLFKRWRYDCKHWVEFYDIGCRLQLSSPLTPTFEKVNGLKSHNSAGHGSGPRWTINCTQLQRNMSFKRKSDATEGSTQELMDLFEKIHPNNIAYQSTVISNSRAEFRTTLFKDPPLWTHRNYCPKFFFAEQKSPVSHSALPEFRLANAVSFLVLKCFLQGFPSVFLIKTKKLPMKNNLSNTWHFVLTAQKLTRLSGTCWQWLGRTERCSGFRIRSSKVPAPSMCATSRLIIR